jgi:phage FluMu protein Com
MIPKDFRCQQCNRLLAKILGSARVEIKCPRCKAMNVCLEEELYITYDAVPKEDPCTDPEIAES